MVDIMIKKRKPQSEETKIKISESRMGDKNWSKRPEVREKMRLAKLGSKNPSWMGGIDNIPYSIDWTKTLKRSIRERDHYTCQICGKEQGDKTLHVHHIDYDKENSNPENLICLCESCHHKTNYNREKWIEYFNNHLT